MKENASLSNTVKKLNRDVSKVVFFVFTVYDNYKFSILGIFFLLNIKNLDSMNSSEVRKQSKFDGMFGNYSSGTRIPDCITSNQFTSIYAEYDKPVLQFQFG